MRHILTSSLALCLVPLALSAQVELPESDNDLLNKIEGQLKAAEDGELTRGLRILSGNNSGDTETASDTELKSLADIRDGESGTALRDDGTVLVSEDLRIDIRIQFEFDSAALTASEQPALAQMCRVMQQAQAVKLFQIVGHTDSAGADDYNKRLSQLRAEEVQRYLVNDCGIAATRLQAVGYGEQFPDNEADTRAPENRRVELQVLG